MRRTAAAQKRGREISQTVNAVGFVKAVARGGRT